MASLIGFDNNRENVEFKGCCKLSINFMSNYLIVVPENEEFKMISASFDWKYVVKKNLLFVFAEFDFLDFCLVFKNEQICKKTFDYIASGKKDITKVDRECCIDKSFILPIYQKITTNPTFQSSLMEVIAEWIQILDEEEKEIYSNLGEISGALQNHYNNKEASNLKENNRKRTLDKAKEIERRTKRNLMRQSQRRNEITRAIKNLNQRAPSNIPKLYSKNISFCHTQIVYSSSLYHRMLLIFTSDKMDAFHLYAYIAKCHEFQCLTYGLGAIVDVNEKDEICVKLETQNYSCKLFTKIPRNCKKAKIIRKPDYQIFEDCIGRSSKVLIHFDSVDRSLCHEYVWNKLNFRCRGCFSKAVGNGVAKIHNEGTPKEYVEIIDENHVCKKRKFQLEKLRPIYDYVLQPDFEIQKYFKRGTERKKLIVFDKNDRTKCYEYFYYTMTKKFDCMECHRNSKAVTAKLQKNSLGEEYVTLSNTKHVCEMRTYNSGKPALPKNSSQAKRQIRKPIKVSSVRKSNILEKQGPSNKSNPMPPIPVDETKIVKMPNFELRPNRAGIPDKTLIILHPSDNTLCYQYYFDSIHKKFRCYNCKLLKITVVAKIVENEKNKEMYVEMGISNHVCEAVKYVPVEFKVVKKPNFELRPSINGVPDRKLIIRHPTDNSLCYEYNIRSFPHLFVCERCRHKKKKHVTAKLHIDEKNNDQYVVMGKTQHFCEPSKYKTL